MLRARSRTARARASCTAKARSGPTSSASSARASSAGRSMPRPSSRAYQGHSGGAPSSCEHRPTDAATPRAAATVSASSTRRVLPVPGSPTTRTAPGSPPAAAARTSATTARSASRPTIAQLAAAGAGGADRADAGRSERATPGRAPSTAAASGGGRAESRGAASAEGRTGAAPPPRGHAPPARGRGPARRRAAGGSRAAPRAPRPAARCAPGPGTGGTSCARAAGAAPGLLGRGEHGPVLAQREQAQGRVLLGGGPQLVEGGPVGQDVRVVAEVGVGRAGPGAQGLLERLDVGGHLLAARPRWRPARSSAATTAGPGRRAGRGPRGLKATASTCAGSRSRR